MITPSAGRQQQKKGAGLARDFADFESTFLLCHPTYWVQDLFASIKFMVQYTA